MLLTELLYLLSYRTQAHTAHNGLGLALSITNYEDAPQLETTTTFFSVEAPSFQITPACAN